MQEELEDLPFPNDEQEFSLPPEFQDGGSVGAGEELAELDEETAEMKEAVKDTKEGEFSSREGVVRNQCSTAFLSIPVSPSFHLSVPPFISLSLLSLSLSLFRFFEFMLEENDRFCQLGSTVFL